MAAQYERHIIQSATPASQAAAVQIERLERCITSAERHLERQKARVREAALAGRSTAVDDFNLQKMELLLALLREGRERVVRQLDVPGPIRVDDVRPAARSASG